MAIRPAVDCHTACPVYYRGVLYGYDGLDQLTALDRGQLTQNTPTPSAARRQVEEDFTLDALGNWSGYLTKASGGTTLSQSRSHNLANEIDTDNTHGDSDNSITETVGTAWADPVHDAAGNMTTMPKPAGPGHRADAQLRRLESAGPGGRRPDHRRRVRVRRPELPHA